MSIMYSSGKVVYTPVISIYDLLDDGTFKTIKKELSYDKLYEFMVFSPRDHSLYTYKGKLHSFGNNSCCTCESPDVIDYLIIDTSKDKNSSFIRIIVNDIRSIKEIETLV